MLITIGRRVFFCTGSGVGHSLPHQGGGTRRKNQAKMNTATMNTATQMTMTRKTRIPLSAANVFGIAELTFALFSGYLRFPVIVSQIRPDTTSWTNLVADPQCINDEFDQLSGLSLADCSR